MKAWTKLAAVAALALPAAMPSPVLATGQDVSTDVTEHADGSRTLVHQTVIAAPVADVWATLSTERGWKMWGPRFARFDLRHGGSIETGYHEGAEAGDPNNIIHRIIAVVPERMIAIQVIQAPEDGPADPDAVKQVWGVYELEPIGTAETRLTISGVGYGRDKASETILQFFKDGNLYSIEALKKNLERAQARD